MKKVCIVTYYDSSNYGSRLQSTALSLALKDLNCDVYFLKSFKARKFTLMHPRMVYARLYNKLNRKKKEAFFHPVPYTISDERRSRLDKYTKENYKVIDIRSDKQWNNICKEKYTFVAGSDIIWQPANGYPSFFFLDYAYFAGLDCLAYGSSLGAKKLPHKFYNAYRKYLRSYKAIGVRETKVKNYLSKIIDKPVTKVVDPTLLITKDKWDKFADKARYSISSDEDFVFCYFVMNDARYWDYVKKVEQATGLKIVVLPMHSLDEEQPYEIIRDGTPYEFIDLIKKAKFIVTDSFHTCVFSMIYEKEFYLLRRTRSDEDEKYNDLLKRYHLEDRRIENEESFIRNEIIDYSYASEKIASDRNQSYEFLKEAIASK